ncbi:MAG: OmpH family outer membrane protein [Acidobacteriota bacterium]|nr:OmpH family outer membrane protein [Acidobacteriota bacterium]
MKRPATRILALAVFTGLILANGFAQTAKIGVLNSNEVLEKSAEGKKAIAQLMERNKKLEDSITKIDDQIRQLETRFNTQRMTLTEEAALQLSADIQKKRTDRTRMAEDGSREMQDLQVRLFTRLQNELLPIIEQLGREKGMDLILDLEKSGAVYFSDAINVTDEVIRRYDASKAGR